MAYRRPPNPHTAYGRKRILNEAKAYNQTLTEKERNEGKLIAYLLVAFVFLIFGGFVYLIGGWEAVLHWLVGA